METMADRLRNVRILKFGPRGKSAFAKALGIPLQTYVHYEQGRIPPPDLLARIMSVARVNPSWLKSGHPPQWMPDHLDVRAEAGAVDVIEALLEEIAVLKGNKCKEDTALYVAQEAAQSPSLHRAIQKALVKARVIVHPNCDAAMMPWIPPGALVGVDETVRQLREIHKLAPRLVSIRINREELAVRRVAPARDYWLLESLDPSIQPIIYASEKDAQIVGRVVYVWSEWP